MKRQYAALRLKKQCVYDQFDNAPGIRYKSCEVVHEYLDQWETPHIWPYTKRTRSWKAHRGKQWKSQD